MMLLALPLFGSRFLFGRLLFRWLGLQGANVIKAEFEVMLELRCLFQETIRNSRVFLHDRSMLFAELRFVFFKEGFAFFGGKAESQCSFLGEEAEHMAIDRCVRHGDTFSFGLCVSGNEFFV